MYENGRDRAYTRYDRRGVRGDGGHKANPTRGILPSAFGRGRSCWQPGNMACDVLAVTLKAHK